MLCSNVEQVASYPVYFKANIINSQGGGGALKREDT